MVAHSVETQTWYYPHHWAVYQFTEHIIAQDHIRIIDLCLVSFPLNTNNFLPLCLFPPIKKILPTIKTFPGPKGVKKKKKKKKKKKTALLPAISVRSPLELVCGPHVTCCIIIHCVVLAHFPVVKLYAKLLHAGLKIFKLILISAQRRQMISFPSWQTQSAAGISYLPLSPPDAFHISVAMHCYLWERESTVKHV